MSWITVSTATERRVPASSSKTRRERSGARVAPLELARVVDPELRLDPLQKAPRLHLDPACPASESSDADRVSEIDELISRLMSRGVRRTPNDPLRFPSWSADPRRLIGTDALHPRLRDSHCPSRKTRPRAVLALFEIFLFFP